MAALLEFKNICRRYRSGEQWVDVLNNVSLSINSGEMVAIIGASGSGKSTLMNILGCLDKPNSGSYFVDGQDIATLNRDQLATLRREHFGFIFQRYHLLPYMHAQHNVEIPAIYAGSEPEKRKLRAYQLLSQLGLQQRVNYKPSQLSGGQQQRVSIARALMNGGQVILADEPTGALDSQSGKEVMAILKDLNQRGHTVVIVTHDPLIAEQANRIIEISDGIIIADHYKTEQVTTRKSDTSIIFDQTISTWQKLFSMFKESLSMSWQTIMANKLRACLTMLGVSIGIASVVSILVIGSAAKNRVLGEIQSIATNTINIYPGDGWGDKNPLNLLSLKEADVNVLAKQPYVSAVSPVIRQSAQLRYNNTDINVSSFGVNEQYFNVFDIRLLQGSLFTSQQVDARAQVVVIDNKLQNKLFKHSSPIGKVILVGNIPLTVIGVGKANDLTSNPDSLNIWIPYTTIIDKVVGYNWLNGIIVRLHDGYSSQEAEGKISNLLKLLHGKKDFFTYNLDTIVKTTEKTGLALQIFLFFVAVISLVVGGIGVMNIMLVSVTERTKEIGIRMAVGARAKDVLQQFLLEAILVCFIGGVLGVLFSLLIGFIMKLSLTGWQIHFSLLTIIGAFVCSTLVGIVFGYLPARNASRLDPIDALARE